MRRALASLALLLGLAAASAAELAPLEDGLWQGRLGGQTFYFELAPRAGGRAGLIHTVQAGRELTQLPIDSLGFDPPRLVLRMDATGVTYEGRADLDAGRIQGALILPDGSRQELPLRRVAWGDVPCLQALPGAPYRYAPPAARDDGWPTAPADSLGLPSTRVEALADAAQRGELGLLHSVLVAVHGHLVVELYFHGFGAEDLHRLASVTKSVGALLVGIALDRGWLDGVETPLLRYFPDLRERAAAGWEALRLDQLLTMSLGLDWSEAETERYGTGPEYFATVLARSPRPESTGHWRYVNADVNLLSGLLHRASGMPVERLAAGALFAPLGIEHWDWSFGAVGDDRLFAGSLRLRPRDLAKLGQLVLDGGRWNGRQVIAADWIEAATARQIVTGQPIEAYGYLWWRGALPLSGAAEPVLLAQGMGSQFVAILPARDMVMVTTGGNEDNGLHLRAGRRAIELLLAGRSVE